MKTLSFLFVFLLGAVSSAKAEINWVVHNYEDGALEGTLRVAIQTACETPDDDLINFMTPAAPGPILIPLGAPLVIPRNCQGRIHLVGHESHETKLKFFDSVGGDIALPGSSCILNIYSDGNTVENLKFFGDLIGASICIFGRDNRIVNNVFGESGADLYEQSYYGVVTSDAFTGRDAGMDGARNTIQDNRFLAGTGVGVYAHSSANVITRNQIQTPQQIGIAYIGAEGTITQNTISDAHETGIIIQGSHVTLDTNTIQNSTLRGVVYEGNLGQITNNTIRNSGQESLLYRGDDAQITSNTILDSRSDAVALEGARFRFQTNPITNAGGNGIIGKISESNLSGNIIHGIGRNGILLAGSDINLVRNEVYEAREEGVVLQGSSGKVYENFIHSNSGSGFSLSGTGFWLYRNRIIANGGCPSKQKRFPSQKVDCFDSPRSNGTGILIENNSTDIIIGGPDFERQANEIQYNHDGGIVLRGTPESLRNNITHNIISNNYGAEPDLDLGGDGVTWNDVDDADEGPNALLNVADYLQVFPLVPSPAGEARYWSWGFARFGSDIEIYRVSDEDALRNRAHGGASVFFGDGEITDRTFRIAPHVDFNSFEDQFVTLLTHDSVHNTSEFSSNVEAGRDRDMDGIVDSREVGEGGTADRTRMDVTDTDGDGLPDSVEDRNRNGVWDLSQGETCAYLADSDGDDLNDWAETHGDGIYDVGIDTNPFERDTDRDGLLDGAEDRNHNGVWDNEAGETSPLLTDSDSDGFQDFRDTCPHVPNPTQESWMCVLP